MNSERNALALAGRFTRLTMVAALVVVGLTQCRKIGDRVTGPEFGRAGTYQSAACVQSCQDAFKRCRDVEEERHRAALRECDRLSGAAREACRLAEDQRNEAEKEACRRAMVECKDNCRYVEGSGAGGR